MCDAHCESQRGRSLLRGIRVRAEAAVLERLRRDPRHHRSPGRPPLCRVRGGSVRPTGSGTHGAPGGPLHHGRPGGRRPGPGRPSRVEAVPPRRPQLRRHGRPGAGGHGPRASGTSGVAVYLVGRGRWIVVPTRRPGGHGPGRASRRVRHDPRHPVHPGMAGRARGRSGAGRRAGAEPEPGKARECAPRRGAAVPARPRRTTSTSDSPSSAARRSSPRAGTTASLPPPTAAPSPRRYPAPGCGSSTGAICSSCRTRRRSPRSSASSRETEDGEHLLDELLSHLFGGRAVHAKGPLAPGEGRVAGSIRTRETRSCRE